MSVMKTSPTVVHREREYASHNANGRDRIVSDVAVKIDRATVRAKGESSMETKNIHANGISFVFPEGEGMIQTFGLVATGGTISERPFFVQEMAHSLGKGESTHLLSDRSTFALGMRKGKLHPPFWL